MAEAGVVKFCTPVGYVKSHHTDDKSPLTHCKFLGPQWYLWNSWR